MNLLQIPIIDEYWVAPQDPASYNRSTDFAISMGFGKLKWLPAGVPGKLTSRPRIRFSESQRRDRRLIHPDLVSHTKSV